MGEEKAREILRNKGMSEVEIQKFLDGIKKGVKAFREGKFKSWGEVKKELNIE